MAGVSTAEKLKRLKWFVVGGAANSIFVELTVFGSLFVLFLDYLGVQAREIGVLLSLFPFTGVLAILIAPYVEMVGYKRVYVIFWGLRKVMIAGLLLLPWIVMRMDSEGVFEYVALIVGLFALCRAIAETAYFPWNKEFVPDRVRGRLEAWTHIAATVTGLLAVGLSSWVLAGEAVMSDYMWLIGVGLLFGLMSVWAFAQLPGGERGAGFRREFVLPNIMVPFRHAQFRRLLWGVGLVSVATGPIVSFLPLYLTEELGLSTSGVLQAGFVGKLGGLLFGYVWGWAADRYGSKPVCMSGLLAVGVFLVLLLGLSVVPGGIFWWVMGVAFWQGSVFIGWHLGFSRLLFSGVVPEENKKDFLAVYYAYMGLIGGLSQIIAGWWLDSGILVSLGGMEWSAFRLLLVFSIVVLCLSVLLFRGIRDVKALSVREFLRFWVVGNPLSAIESVVRYSWAGDEKSAVRLTEKLGNVRSHLTVNELLDALGDPRFNVRYEAVIAIARARANAKLIKGLEKILRDGDPALSVSATWALGRIGNYRCIEILRETLNHRRRSVREQAVRSLSYLGIEDVAEELHVRYGRERDVAMRVALCGYFGKVQYTAALPEMLRMVRSSQLRWRKELCLAVARMFGVERLFVRHLKTVEEDLGTGLGMLLDVKRKTVVVDEVHGKRLGEAFVDEDWVLAMKLGMEKLSEGRDENVQETLKVLGRSLKGKESDYVLWVLGLVV